MKYDEIVWTWFESLVFGLDFCCWACGNLWKLWCTRSSWSNSSGDGALGHPWPPCKIHVRQLLLQHLAASWWYWKHFEAFWSNRSLCTQMLWALSADTDLAECRTCHLIKISNISIGIVRLFPLIWNELLLGTFRSWSRCRAPSERESGCNFMQCRQKLFKIVLDGFGLFKRDHLHFLSI